MLHASKFHFKQESCRDIWRLPRSGIQIEMYTHAVLVSTPTTAVTYRWAPERNDDSHAYICLRYDKTQATLAESSCSTRSNLETLASSDFSQLFNELRIEKAENKNQLLSCHVCAGPLSGTYIACGCTRHAYCSQECCENDEENKSSHIDINFRRLFKRGKGKANMRVYAQAICGEFSDADNYEYRLNESSGRLIVDLPPELIPDGRLAYTAFNRAIRMLMFDRFVHDTLDRDVQPLIRLYQTVNQLSLQRRSQEVAWTNFVTTIRRYIRLARMASTASPDTFIDDRPAAAVAVLEAAVRLGDVLDGHRLKKVSSARQRPTPGRSTSLTSN